MPTPNLRENAPSLPPLTITINAACALLSIGRTKMYELIADGRVQTVVLGKRRLVIYASLHALIGG